MNFLTKAMAMFKKASGEGLLKLSPEQHEKHTNVRRGLMLGLEVYGDLLEDLSPNDPDSPGVLTIEEAGVRLAERLGARAAGNS